MKLYLDEDAAAHLLARLLEKAGHDVRLTSEAGLAGRNDPVQLSFAIDNQRMLLSRNHHDFEELHELVRKSGGTHPGILIVRKDNDPTRDMSLRGIVVALKKLEAANFPLRGEFVILNHWR